MEKILMFIVFFVAFIAYIVGLSVMVGVMFFGVSSEKLLYGIVLFVVGGSFILGGVFFPSSK